MNPDTGALYPSLADAIAAGEREDDLVEIHGTREQAEKISRSIKVANRQRNKAARKSRKRNRS